MNRPDILPLHYIGYAVAMLTAASGSRHFRSQPAIWLMAAGIAVFVVAALAGALGLKRTGELTERRTRGYSNLVQIEAVLSTLKDLESGQRGFLITGDESFLKPYLDARRELDNRYQAMRADMPDVALPEDFWTHLDSLIQDRIRIAEKNIELRRQGLFLGETDLKRLTEGKHVMDAIRNEFETLKNYRRQEIESIFAALEDERQFAVKVTLGAGLFGFMLMVIALGLFRREQQLRLNAEAVLASANKRLESEVRSRTQDLEAALEHIRSFASELDQGIEAERRRLAREVHDQIGQIFTAMKLLIRPRTDGLTEEARLQQSDEFIRLLDEGITTARRITAELQPPLLDDLGLGAALEHYFAKYGAASGVSCRVEVEHDACLNRVQATALFRIAQEALTNVLRHASANLVVIGDRLKDDTYHLIIEDDGQGFPEGMRASFGLRGMEERAKLVGGNLVVLPADKRGVRVEVTLPINGEKGERAT